MNEVLLVVLGAALALAGGFISDELARRRRVRHSARLLLFHLGLLKETFELDASERFNEELNERAREYLAATADLREPDFEPHRPIVARLWNVLIESRHYRGRRAGERGEDLNYHLRLVADIRRALARVLEEDEAGFMARWEIEDLPSPIRDAPPPEPADQE